MSLLDLPSRHHALHVLGLLAPGEPRRFGELVRSTGHHDAQIGRALDFLKAHDYVRARTVSVGAKIVLAYGVTQRGQAAWEAFEAYRAAIRSRARVLGREAVQAVDDVLST